MMFGLTVVVGATEVGGVTEAGGLTEAGSVITPLEMPTIQDRKMSNVKCQHVYIQHNEDKMVSSYQMKVMKTQVEY